MKVLHLETQRLVKVTHENDDNYFEANGEAFPKRDCVPLTKTFVGTKVVFKKCVINAQGNYDLYDFEISEKKYNLAVEIANMSEPLFLLLYNKYFGDYAQLKTKMNCARLIAHVLEIEIIEVKAILDTLEENLYFEFFEGV